MSWRDVIVLAGRSIRRRAGRAVLTVVGIALAAALLSALLTIAGTARTRVLDQLANGGPLAAIQVAAAAPDPTQVDTDDAKPGPPRDLDEAAVQEIAALDAVRTVVPIRVARVVVVPPDPLTLADGRTVAFTGSAQRDQIPGARFESIVGVDLDRIGDIPVTLLAGRLPVAGSPVEVAVTPTWLARFGLGRTDADAMVGTELVVGAPRSFGRTIRARWTRLQVVGVVAQEAGSGALFGDDAIVSAARAWTEAGVDDDRIDIPTSPYSGAVVVAAGLDNVPRVRRDIQDIGYSTRAPENLIATVQRYLHVVEIVLSGIGVIALVIAALGVSNAMLAAVRERRREIGVLKAIGARDRDVLRVFLAEAAFLGLVGGLLGTILGLGVAGVVGAVVNGYLRSQGLVGVRPVLPLALAASTVIGAGVLSLVAGGLPAWRAAHLPAREAVDA